MKIVVTGPAGGGKSTVMSVLQLELGEAQVKFINVDEIVRKIWRDPQSMLGRQEYFEWIKITGGKDFWEYGTQLLLNDELRISLENFMGPIITRILSRQMADYPNVIIEFPLFAEKWQLGNGWFDMAIIITAPAEARKLRLEMRGWSDELITKVMQLQLTDEHRLRATTDHVSGLAGVHVVNTTGTIMDSIREAKSLAHTIREGLDLNERIGVIGGSFDPFTKGHLHLVVEASKLMDKLIIALARNPQKKYKFDEDMRVKMIKASLLELPQNVQDRISVAVVPDDELLVMWAHDRGARFMFRGLRSATDLEFEGTVQYLNTKMADDVTTILIPTPRQLIEVSSSLIRGVLHLKDWRKTIEGYVTDGVLEIIATYRELLK